MANTIEVNNNTFNHTYTFVILFGLTNVFLTYMLVLHGKSGIWHKEKLLNEDEEKLKNKDNIKEEKNDRHDFDKVLKKYLDARSKGLSLDEIAINVFGVRSWSYLPETVVTDYSSILLHPVIRGLVHQSKWDQLRVALSRVGTSQAVPSSFRGCYIFKYFTV